MSDSGPADLLAEVKAWRDRMCACVDRACVDKIYDEFRTWRHGLPRLDGDRDPLESLKAPWEALEHEMKVCRKKVPEK